MLSKRDRAEVGAYNYFVNGGGESGTSGLSTFNTTWTSGLPGTITSGSTLVSLASVTTNVLSGGASNQFVVGTASGSAGHGWITDVMTLSDADLAKILAVAFDYNFVSGNSNVNVSGTDAGQTIQVWVYNVGSSSWIQPAGYNSINTNGTSTQLIPGRTQNIVFQSGISNASNNNQYRIAWIIRNAPSGVFSMNIDNIYFGRQVSPASGPAMTDWTAFTPTLAGYTATSNVGYWRRVGDSMEVHVDAVLSSALTGAMNVYLPAGYTYNPTSSNAMCGLAAAAHSNGTTINGVCTPDSGGTFVRCYGGYATSTNGRWGATVPFTWASTDEISVNFTVPIVGWSSNCVMSQDSNTRVCVAKYNTSTQTVTTTYSPLIATTKEIDTHGAYNASTGQFTCPSPGIYRVSAEGQGAVTSSSAANQNGIGLLARKNSSIISVIGAYTFSNTGVNIAPIISGSVLLQCNAGDVLDVAVGHDASVSNYALLTGSSQNWVSFELLTGPAVIAATESVSMKYNSGSTAIGTSVTALVYTTKEWDSHNAFSTSTGLFTVPVSGKYRISGGYAGNTAVSSTGTNNGFYLWAMQNGSSKSKIAETLFQVTTGSIQPSAYSTCTLNCNAGDTIAIGAHRDSVVGAYSMDNTSNENWICIERIGN